MMALCIARTHRNLGYALISIFAIFSQAWAQAPVGLTVSSHDVTVLVNKTESFDVLVRDPFTQDFRITLIKQHDNMVDLDPMEFSIMAGSTQNQTILINGLKPGHLEVTAESQPNEKWVVEDIYLRITVANSEAIIYTSLIFGWIYFVAWSVSFYPQIWTNFKRKSVVGLNFDFVFLNIVGFTLYSIFNCGLYWVPGIQDEYFERYPRGLNPVMLNDVVFSLHAMFATCITIYQCFAYERAEQRVSKIASGLVGLFAAFVIISAGLAAGNVIHWLDFLYYCSYVKLTITIIKYVPQALMNYRRKSTVGWSIGNILLDFTGGTLSMLQMILNAYNYDDWVSIFGDPTKFGLGLFSVLFDIFFMLQHYVFYSISHSSVAVNCRCSNFDIVFREGVCKCDLDRNAPNESVNVDMPDRESRRIYKGFYYYKLFK
ncbi:cystinosin homolog isoform X1 [Stomoxys calcitrans]|uniref:cystinosin homolog isoform X1 n=1 Tax=Stomoxys calcitrans TaxID=35570 RepID=UPI0027E382A5|nr:cystinosin homolog isoform X1 [Stomoxys calcitrans]XP_059219070.1 cystinosin homolog isoform X1 [Stomoxys calcitrans]